MAHHELFSFIDIQYDLLYWKYEAKEWKKSFLIVSNLWLNLEGKATVYFT